jgi:hypothetical protein
MKGLLDTKKSELTDFMERQLEPFLAYELKERSVYSKREHLRVLLSASLMNGFATGVSDALGDSPTGETLLSYIKTQSEEVLRKAFDGLVNENVSRLRRQKRRFRMPLPVAVDLHDVMYYGDHDSTRMVIGTKPTAGSCYAFEYLTASVLADGERLIVAVVSLRSRKEIPARTAEIIRRLREELRLRIRYLVFDGGFFNAAILRLLEDSKLRYIVRIAPTTKTKRMRTWHGRRFRYTTSGHRRKESEQASFDVVVVVDGSKPYKYLFATNLPSYYRPETILELYKTRWGIETSYRMSNQFLIRTTSRNYTVRLFYYLFACLAYNAWIMYNNSRDGTGEAVPIGVIQLKITLLIGLIISGMPYVTERKRT